MAVWLGPYPGRTEILITKLEPDSGKAKNNSPQMQGTVLVFLWSQETWRNVSLRFILVLLLRPSSRIISYAYACIAKTALACPFYTLYNSYDWFLFWLINIQLHLRMAYKMVWLMVMKFIRAITKRDVITTFSIFNMALVRCNVLLIPKFKSPIFLFAWLFCTAITTIMDIINMHFLDYYFYYYISTSNEFM